MVNGLTVGYEGAEWQLVRKKWDRTVRPPR